MYNYFSKRILHDNFNGKPNAVRWIFFSSLLFVRVRYCKFSTLTTHNEANALSHSFAGAIITPTNGQSVCNIVCAKKNTTQFDPSGRFVSVAPTICHLTRALRNWFFHLQDTTHTHISSPSLIHPHTDTHTCTPFCHYRIVELEKCRRWNFFWIFTLFESMFLEWSLHQMMHNQMDTTRKQNNDCVLISNKWKLCYLRFCWGWFFVFCLLSCLVSSCYYDQLDYRFCCSVVLWGKLTEKAIEIDWRCQILFSNAMARFTMKWHMRITYRNDFEATASDGNMAGHRWDWRFFVHDISIDTSGQRRSGTG